MRKISFSVATVAAAVFLAACSSGGSTSTNTSNPGGGGSTNSAGASGASGTTAANKYLQQWLKTPTSINISTPLSKKPPTGKSLVGMNNGSGSGKALTQYWGQAAHDFGWKFQNLVYPSTPEGEQKTVDSAISVNPSGILTSGIPNQTIKSQLRDAASRGIWLNSSADADPPSGAMFDTSIANPAQLRQWGKMVAAYVVVQSKGKAVIQDFSLPVFPILEEFDKAFQAAIKEWCSGCSVGEHPQQATDIGTKTPVDVVSVVQANPKTNWLIFDLGDLETGVDAALGAAGLQGRHIGGLTADIPNIEALKSKKQDVWTGYSLPVVAYRQLDSMARKFLGDPILDAALPTQLITQDNVNSIVADSAGNYVGVKDYRQQFDALWRLSG
jgi:ABC-type sugar transport system substrate-binding protein